MVCFMVHRQTIKTQTQMSMTHLEKKSKFSKLWFACTTVLFFTKSFQMEGHLHESPVNNSFHSQHYNSGHFNSGYLYIISPDTMLLFSRDLCLWCCPFEFGYKLLFMWVIGLPFCRLAIHRLEVTRNDLRTRIAKEVYCLEFCYFVSFFIEAQLVFKNWKLIDYNRFDLLVCFLGLYGLIDSKWMRLLLLLFIST
jgi:hypothetical protein